MNKILPICFLVFFGLSTTLNAQEISIAEDTVSVTLEAATSQTFNLTVANQDAVNDLNWSAVLEDTFGPGDTVNFLKEDFANWLLAPNQDRISDLVWIARNDTRSIFNAKKESDSDSQSPEGTLWSLGPVNELEEGGLVPFITMHGGNPPGLIGQTVSLFLEESERYFNVDFTAWSGGGPGGSFGYERVEQFTYVGIDGDDSGVIGASSDANISVTVDAMNISSGTYYSRLLVISDDADEDSTYVVIETEVLPFAEIVVSEEELFNMLTTGDPDSTQTFEIINRGSSSLVWETTTDDRPAGIDVQLNSTGSTIAPGDTLEVEVTFNPGNTPDGTYQWPLIIESNDPMNPEVLLDIVFEVVGVPEIVGIPDVSFGNVFSGTNYSSTFTIENSGTGALSILDIFSDSTELSFDQTELVIAPQSSEEIIAFLTPEVLGDIEAAVYVASNDTTSMGANDTIMFTVTASVLGAPIIEVDNIEFSFDLTSNDSTGFVIEVSNSGASDLNFSFDREDENGLGETVFFEKLDNADFNLDVNQDSLSPDVRLTRGDRWQLFNYIEDPTQTRRQGWTTFEMAWGATSEVDPNDYENDWRDFRNNSPNGRSTGIVGGTSSLHLINEDRYFDLMWTNWTSGGNGGGFSYIRQEIFSLLFPNDTLVESDNSNDYALAPGESVQLEFTVDARDVQTGTYNPSITLYSNDPETPEQTIDVSVLVNGGGGNANFTIDTDTIKVTLLAGGIKDIDIPIKNNANFDLNASFTGIDAEFGESVFFEKLPATDEALEENQDRISDIVWITREFGGNRGGLYNYYERPQFERNSSTIEWAIGPTADAEAADYSDNFISDIARQIPNNAKGLPGNTLSLHTLVEDEYYDLAILSWGIGDGADGGAFSYNRTRVLRFLSAESAVPFVTIAENDSTVFEFSIDTDRFSAGTYVNSINISLNFGLNEINIPVELTVLGVPELAVDNSTIAFDTLEVGFEQTYLLEVANVGSDVLDLTNISSSNAVFELDAESLTIGANESEIIEVTFVPTGGETYQGTISFDTNDELNPTVSIDVIGVGVLGPVLEIDKTELIQSLFLNEVVAESFVISNTGQDDLEWELALDRDAMVFFGKDDFADQNLPENQDRITNNVWLTRGNQAGIYNAVLENSYDRSTNDSPLGTQWTFGPFTDDLSNLQDWRDAIRDSIDMSQLASVSVLAYLTEDDLFYEFDFLSWTGNSQGGGMSYYRTPVFGPYQEAVDFTETSGVVAPGESVTVTVTFNPLTTYTGTFEIPLQVLTNDPDNIAYDLPLFMNVASVVTQQPIDDVAVNEGFTSATIDVSNTFTDAQGDNLVYSAESDNENVVTVEIVNNTDLVITETGVGSARISVFGEDPSNNVGTETLIFRVNGFTFLDEPAEDIDVTIGFNSTSIDLAEIFGDPDGPNDLTFTALSSSDSAVNIDLSGSILSFEEVGAGSTMISLTAADGLGPEVTDDFIFTVNKFPQEVTFDAISESTFGDADITLVGSASSGLDVVFTSSNTEVATIDGNILSIVGAGESTISAVQPGTETLARVVVEQNLIVNKADQTITFNEISDVAIGDITSFDLTGIGFASSGLPVSYESSDESVATISGVTVTLVGSGLVAIIATQEGNEDFNPAESVFQILTVNPRVLGLGDQIEQLHPYPNPTRDYLNIDVSGVDGKLELQLLDLNGRAVENGYSFQSKGNIIRLDVRQLAAGTYLLEVENNDESIRYKFVKD